MMTVIESNVMVNPLNDMSNFKRVEADNNLPRSQTMATEKAEAVETSSVNLSRTSKQIAALKELLIHEPEISRERIAFLKNELSSGTYRILDYNIAIKMFNDLSM